MDKRLFYHVILFSILTLLACNKNTEEGKLRIACIGDSITYGAGIWNRGKNSYPARLNKLMGDNWDVGNFGVNGATLLKKGDKSYWNQREFRDALEYEPHLVVIKLGTNDTKTHNWVYKNEFISDYKELISRFANLSTNPVIYICYPIPIYSSVPTGLETEMMPMIDVIAKETNSRIIDLYSALEGKSDLYWDGVHPNKKGAALIAEKIYSVLKEDGVTSMVKAD